MTAAAADAIAAAELDPLAEWISRKGLRPLVTAVTMAQVLHSIKTDPDLSEKERQAYRPLPDEAVRDNEDLLVNADSGFQEARVLAEIMETRSAGHFGKFSLVPAAIAMCRGHTLVTVERIDEWSAFAYRIPRAIGKLDLKVSEGTAREVLNLLRDYLWLGLWSLK